MPARGGGRNKSGGGGARPPPSREETVSKAMAYVLRHGAEKEKLKLDESGYISCEELVGIIQDISYFIVVVEDVKVPKVYFTEYSSAVVC